MSNSNRNATEQVKQLKLLFDAGLLDSVTAVPGVMDHSEDWMLIFRRVGSARLGSPADITLIAARGDVRYFSSLKSILNTIKKIGFQKVTFLTDSKDCE